MEIYLYLFGITLSAYICAKSEGDNKNQRAIILAILLFYLIVSRFQPEGDIDTYYNAMTTVNFSPYYLTEPIIWLTQQAIFYVTKSQQLTFLVCDIFFLYLLNLIRTKANLSNYFLLTAFFSLPIFLGHQNIYRQLFSMLFIMLAILHIDKNESFKTIVFIILGIGSHLSALIFIPIILAQSKSRFIKFISWFMLVIFMFFAQLFSNYKSSAGTFADTSILYVSVILFLSLIYHWQKLLKLKIKLDSNQQTLILLAMLLGASTSVFGSIVTERLGLTALFIALVMICMKLAEKRESPNIRLVLTLIYSMPVIAHPGLRQFI